MARGLAPRDASFARRGLKAAVRCGSSGTARASVWVSRTAAQRLGLRSRRLASRSLACSPDRTVTVRVRASRAARERLARRRASLRVSLRLTRDGAAAVARTVRLRAGR